MASCELSEQKVECRNWLVLEEVCCTLQSTFSNGLHKFALVNKKLLGLMIFTWYDKARGTCMSLKSHIGLSSDW